VNGGSRDLARHTGERRVDRQHRRGECAVGHGWLAIFQAAPGTVTVDNSAGAVTVSGAQFAVNGYTITGAPLTTTTADSIIRVGDGTGAGAAMTATINAVIQGSGGIDKTDLGTLVLAGANTYTGGTTIGAARSRSQTTTIWAMRRHADFQRRHAADHGRRCHRSQCQPAERWHDQHSGNTDVFSGVISGAGNLAITGAGGVTLTGTSTYTGTTTITAAILSLGNSTASGTVVGRIVDNGILRFAHTGPITYAGVISGAGILQKALGNTLTLTGDSTYTGLTKSSMELCSSAMAARPAGVGPGDIEMFGTGALTVNHSNALTLAQLISGTGPLRQLGTANNNADRHQHLHRWHDDFRGRAAAGRGRRDRQHLRQHRRQCRAGVHRSNNLTYAGIVSGTGTLAQSGAGTLTLSGANTYAAVAPQRRHAFDLQRQQSGRCRRRADFQRWHAADHR